ncbi:MAG: hypothetical protein Q9169_008068 [Polycauliona sp. 2 TL-2023]
MANDFTKESEKGSEVDVLMAALWMARCSIKTLVIDKRDAKVRAGHADGIQCRTLEILESFGIVDRIWKESCHMAEMCMWNPGIDGLIQRSSRMPNTIPGVSRFPCGVTLAQHRIEDVLLQEIHKYAMVEICRQRQKVNQTRRLRMAPTFRLNSLANPGMRTSTAAKAMRERFELNM